MRTFPKNIKRNKKYYQLNYHIQEKELRVIDDNGKQLGIISKDEALKIAQSKQMDLVLIAPQAKPPVAKIIDFKKFLYQENKKRKEEKKGIKKSTVKDVKLSLFIGPADLERLINKGKEFLSDGHQLRINLPLKGRENTKKTMAFDLINRFISGLGEINISKPPKFEGQVLRAVITRKK